ncbi:MAG: penicillin acylase family protein [Flavitalea sp.]
MKISLIYIILLLACNTSGEDKASRKLMKDRATNITIIRDNWGIPHVYGKTDADAVFGLMYAQCEESFERVERSYIQRLGRLAEIEGEAYIYEDLETRLIYDTAEAIMDYKNSDPWLKDLLLAFADGINYYLANNPMVKPKLLDRFEPWYPLMFTDGGLTATQTGGATTSDLKALYGLTDISTSKHDGTRNANANLNGSNAFAIGPKRTSSGNAMLYINPHVNFYFRTEAHMVSEEGLNAYGAVTWGQFFVFQGFNENCGWMHTSSLADAADLYEESIVRAGNTFFYKYDDSLRKLTTRSHIFKIKGKEKPLTITAFYTHHGPVIGIRNGKWLSLREENRTVNGLVQSWQRTKSRNYEEFKKIIQLRGNNSCNTMYADRDGTIAYWHGNFIPQRNNGFDYSQPLDGRTKTTEWKGIHSIDQLIHLENPSTGWLQNCNSSPFLATTSTGLVMKNYPSYMAPDGENFRSKRAAQLLSQEDSITLDKLIAIGYDRYLAAFDSMLPPLFESYNNLKPSDSLYSILKEPIDLLKNWDRCSSTSSIATTLAVEWAYKVINLNYYLISVEDGRNQVALFSAFARQTSIPKRLELLREVTTELEEIYGTWKMAWGNIVRFQRTSGDIIPKFDDERISTPVGFASSLFGCLPAYEAIWNGSGKSYGVAGNSFVAAVEFGKKVRAKSIVTAGQSFKPASLHFKDQLQLFLNGKLKDVHFYKEDVMRNKSSSYHPGE